jgi:membrane-associated PAP2 superfamily phosphatase
MNTTMTMTVPLPNDPPRHDLALTLASLALLLCWEASGWDLALTSLYGNAQGFALREHWGTKHLLHDGGRWLAGLALVGLAWSAWRGRGSALPGAVRWAWFGVVLLCLVAVPALKQLSHTSCPRELAMFGGHAPYVPHWLLTLRDGGSGRCFPAGHPVAAFAFLPLYFQWRAHRPSLARAMLVGVLALGALLGWAQMARGAHFASHAMWSAWCCWAIAAAAARWLEPQASEGNRGALAAPALRDQAA